MAGFADRPVPDHVMYAAPDLEAASEDLEAKTGVRAVFGGEHEGMGTHNALMSFGEMRYLEIIAPTHAGSLALQPGGLLAELAAPRIFMWAVACSDIQALTDRARQQGYDSGTVIDMSRLQPSGQKLQWKLSVGGQDVVRSVVPFCIQWLGSPHPSESTPAGCRMADLHAEHPEPQRIAAALAALQVDLEVEQAEQPGLVLTLDTPKGKVTLR